MCTVIFNNAKKCQWRKRTLKTKNKNMFQLIIRFSAARQLIDYAVVKKKIRMTRNVLSLELLYRLL